MTAAPRELDVDTLFATSEDPFVLHHVDPATTRRAWAAGTATVVDGARGRPGERLHGPVYTCFGEPVALGPLMAYVDSVTGPPWRVSVAAGAVDALPPAWRMPDPHGWIWMLTDQAPGAVGGEPVEEVTDAAEIGALLEVANPDSWARPGAPGIATWLGVRHGDQLVAAGALLRMHEGTLHLRGVSVLPAERGRRLGTTLSAALTRYALEHGSGVATLGVYADNRPAVRIYERLGYRAVHTFRSGLVGA